MSHRRSDFKRHSDSLSGADRRHVAADQLRKHRRDQSLASKRFKGDADASHSSTENHLSSANVSSPASAAANADHLISEALSRPFPQSVVVLRDIRKALSSTDECVLQAYLRMDLVSFLTACLRSDHAEAKFEAAWCITNLAVSESPSLRLLLETVPALLEMIRQSPVPLQEQAVWAVGNIAGESLDCCDDVRTHGGLGVLLAVFMESRSGAAAATAKKQTSDSQWMLIRTTSWALVNLLRGHDPSIADAVRAGIIPVLTSHLSAPQGPIVELAWLCCYLSARHINEFFQQWLETQTMVVLLRLLAAGVGAGMSIPGLQLVPSLGHGDDAAAAAGDGGRVSSSNSSSNNNSNSNNNNYHSSGVGSGSQSATGGEDVSILFPVIRSIANLLSGPEALVAQFVGQHPGSSSSVNLLVQILASVDPQDRALRKESAIALTNIAGSGPSFVDALVVPHGAFFVDRFRHGDHILRGEMAYLIANLVADGRYLHQLMVGLEALPVFVSLARTSINVDSLMLSVQMMELVCSKLGPTVVEDHGGKDVLEKLADSPHVVVARKANEVLDIFYQAEA